VRTRLRARGFQQCRQPGRLALDQRLPAVAHRQPHPGGGQRNDADDDQQLKEGEAA
jgi:hypothetical protein